MIETVMCWQTDSTKKKQKQDSDCYLLIGAINTAITANFKLPKLT